MKENTKDILTEIGGWALAISVIGSFLWLTHDPNPHKDPVTPTKTQPTQGMNPVIKYHYFRKIGGFK